MDFARFLEKQKIICKDGRRRRRKRWEKTDTPEYYWGARKDLKGEEQELRGKLNVKMGEKEHPWYTQGKIGKKRNE